MYAVVGVWEMDPAMRQAQAAALERIVPDVAQLPGVVNGCLLVFTLCLGFYVTPVLLGSPRDMMISQVIAQQVEELLAWGFASALSVVLLAATSVVIVIYTRFVGLDRLWG